MYASIFRAPLSAPALDAYSATASNGASNAAAVAACAPLPTRHGLGTGALGRCGRARAAPTCVPDATCSCSPYFLLIFALIFALFWCHVIPYRVICDNGLLWKICGVAATTNDSSLPRHRCHSFLSRNQSGRAHFAPPRPFLTGGAGPWARHARLRALRPHSRRPDVHPRPQFQSVFSADLCAAVLLLCDPISYCMGYKRAVKNIRGQGEKKWLLCATPSGIQVFCIEPQVPSAS